MNYFNPKNIKNGIHVLAPYFQTYPINKEFSEKLKVSRENILNNVFKYDRLQISEKNLNIIEDLKPNKYYLLELDNDLFFSTNVNKNIHQIGKIFKNCLEKNIYLGFEFTNMNVFYQLNDIAVFCEVSLDNLDFSKVLSGEEIPYIINQVNKENMYKIISSPNKFFGLDSDGKLCYFESYGNLNYIKLNN